MNVAVGACRLGHPTNFCRPLRPDAYGESINAHLNASLGAAAASNPPRSKPPSPRPLIGADGAAEYEFDIEWALDAIAEESG